MVKFTIKGGRSVPQFDGIIVCEEHVDALLTAHQAREKVLIEKREVSPLVHFCR